MKAELKTLAIDITKIDCPQTSGYKVKFTKLAAIKHRKKKINGIWYNTIISDLIFYKNKYEHDNNFTITFIYKAFDGNYFRREFNSMGETFELISEKMVLFYINTNNSLF